MADIVFAELAVFDNQHIVDQYPFFLHRPAVGRHGTRCYAANIRMMAARRHKIGRQLVGGVDEYRHDDGDVRQMRSAIIGGVEGINIARANPPPVKAACSSLQDRTDTFAH